MADTLEQALKRTRAGYDDERRWHRFLIDAYQGSGGFRGRIGCPEAELGSAATVYGECTESYLDKYPREDDAKFKRRVLVAHYLNYIEPLTDLKAGLAISKPYKVENLPSEIEAWKTDVDGKGTTFDALRARLVRRAAIVGWAPTIVDLPPKGEGIATAAQARNARIAPRLVALYPGNLTEWELDDESRLRWLKVRNDFVERPNITDDPVNTARIDVWYVDRVDSYRLVDEALNGTPVTVPRSSAIPLTILRHKEAEDDPMIGLPMNGQVSIEARRLFNLLSSLDEALDGSCFPVLVLAEDLGPDTNAPEGGDEIVVGAKNALTLAKDSSQKHYFLSPPAEVFSALEKRIEVTVHEMWRMARVEFVRPAGSQNESGLARKHAFQQTNTAIEDFARCIALWEQATYVEVGRALGLGEDLLAQIRVVAPDDFDIDDIEGALNRLEQAMRLKLGRTFESVLKKRVAQEMAPNLDPDTKQIVEQEIDDMATDDAAGDSFDRSADSVPDGGSDGATNPNEVTGGTIGSSDRAAGAGAGAP